MARDLAIWFYEHFAQTDLFRYISWMGALSGRAIYHFHFCPFQWGVMKIKVASRSAEVFSLKRRLCLPGKQMLRPISFLLNCEEKKKKHGSIPVHLKVTVLFDFPQSIKQNTWCRLVTKPYSCCQTVKFKPSSPPEVTVAQFDVCFKYPPAGILQWISQKCLKITAFY